MYAIRSKRTNRWFQGIDTHVGSFSSHRIIMGDIPQLYKTRELARVDLLTNRLSNTIFDILEVELIINEELCM